MLTATDLIQPVHKQYLTNAGNMSPIFIGLIAGVVCYVALSIK